MKNLQKGVNNFKKFSAQGTSNFENSLRSRFPRAFKIYTILKNGTQRFGNESLMFLRIMKQLMQNPKSLESLKWNEVNVYRELPRDWKKVAPVMLIASFPFLNYIVLPLAYLYPQKLLCKQFWTPRQKAIFNEAKFNNNLVLHDRVIINLKEQIENSLTRRDNLAKNVSIDLIDKIHFGRKVDLNEVLELKKILNKPEFNLHNLTQKHLQNLVDLHNCQRLFTRSKLVNLEHYAFWLNQEDKKLMLENLEGLDAEYINSFSFERGVNANELSLKELIEFLQVWFNFSSQMGFSSNKSYLENNYTLYLHAKVLLSTSHNAKRTEQIEATKN